MKGQGRRDPALYILWGTFALGLVAGVWLAGRMPSAQLTELREQIRQGLQGTVPLPQAVLRALRWTVPGALAALFASCAVLLPVLLAARGATLAYTAAAFLSVCGWKQGGIAYLTFGGVGDILLTLGLALWSGMHLTALTSGRRSWENRACLADRFYFCRLAVLFLPAVGQVLLDTVWAEPLARWLTAL